MGNFFSNIHIKKDTNTSSDILKNKLIKFMNSNGYNLEENSDNADGKITIYSSNDSKWITVFSDLFEINNSDDFKKIYNSFEIDNDFIEIYFSLRDVTINKKLPILELRTPPLLHNLVKPHSPFPNVSILNILIMKG